MLSDDQSLRELPAVGELLRVPAIVSLIDEHGRFRVRGWLRESFEQVRSQLVAGELSAGRAELAERLIACVTHRAKTCTGERFGRVINATGVILHTGLGRAPLAPAAVAALTEAGAACNLEIDLEEGKRQYRGHQLDAAWQSLTGAEASLVVNNNAAATLLVLQTLCISREVIISRGQLIEIGGAFRLPEIFALSGAMLREVGTTNHTRLADYEAAISPQTAAILRVHPSNYRVVGFAGTPEIAPLAALARSHGLLAIDDIGSGCLSDLSQIPGLPAEPTFGNSLAAGADVVMGSGDKLLGGPQCGILLGKRDLISKMRHHPLARAIRIDKLTLAALAATLDIYQRGREYEEIPVLKLLAASIDSLRSRAARIQEQIGSHASLKVTIDESVTPMGGGSLPAAELPTVVLGVEYAALPAEQLAKALRVGPVRVAGRIHHDRLLLDLRSVNPANDARLIEAIRLLAQGSEPSPLHNDGGRPIP